MILIKFTVFVVMIPTHSISTDSSFCVQNVDATHANPPTLRSKRMINNLNLKKKVLITRKGKLCYMWDYMWDYIKVLLPTYFQAINQTS